MKKIESAGRTIRGVALGLGLSIATASVAEAQRPIPGFTRSDQSDVTGPSVTSGDQLAALFTEPGTIMSMYCPVAWGVGTAGEQLQVRLASAELRPALMVGPRSLGSTAQLQVLNLMTATSREGSAAAEPVITALTANNARASERQARRLAGAVRGLLTEVEEIDPLSPGEGTPTRLANAVGAYNGFINASSPEFLANPPEQLSAIHAVLNQLVIASLENEDRPIEPEVVDAAGRACAIITPPAPPPPPPVEQAFEMCVLDGNEFRDIAVIRRPELGDSVVILNGERRPLTEIYPTATEVPSPPWVPLAEPVTIDSRQYQPFGVSRRVSPEELQYRGEHMGYSYFTTPDESITSPTVVYFLAGPECEVQPYRSAETIRVRG